MKNRDKQIEKVKERLEADSIKFKDLDNINFDLILQNKDGMLQDTVLKIIKYINNNKKERRNIMFLH